ncbi:MAG: hypothetical protein K0Q59_3756, partial [Paenibacillus sp.]|nr:hypothetical protein [Paenibacillus sp.]
DELAGDGIFLSHDERYDICEPRIIPFNIVPLHFTISPHTDKNSRIS